MGEPGRDIEVISIEEARLIPVEANLEIPPLFQMRRTNPSNRVAECWVHAVTPQGERLEQYWRVSVPEPWELPGPFDQDVWVAMQTLVNRRGGMREDGRVFFSMYELLDIMGKPANGRNYEDLKNSLLRLSAAHIYSGNAFYSKDIDDYEDRGFGLWDVRLRRRIVKNSGEETERHELEFHSLVRRSFQAGYLKALDADFYYSLSSRYAKRLYRLIDRKRQENLGWTASFERLKQLLPLSPSYRSPSKIKDVLKPAHRELRERGFLAEASFEKGKSPKYRYRVNREFVGGRNLLDMPQLSLFPSANSGEAEAEVASRLREKGVWPNVAPKLAARGVDRCLEALSALPYQVGLSDPGAWLKWAIETGDFEVPKGKNLSGSRRKSYSSGGVAREVSRHDGLFVEDGSEIDEPAADPDARDLWESILEDIGSEMSAPSFDVWFKGTVPVSLSLSTLSLSLPNSVAKEYIASRFLKELESCLRKKIGENAEIEMVVRGGEGLVVE